MKTIKLTWSLIDFLRRPCCSVLLNEFRTQNNDSGQKIKYKYSTEYNNTGDNWKLEIQQTSDEICYFDIKYKRSDIIK